MATGRSAGGRGIRMLIIFAIMALGLIGFGIYELSKDLGSSHGDFSTMETSEFRNGDILHSTISECIGCAVRYEVKSSKSSSTYYTYYYIVPYFSSVEADVPDKVLCYATGNNVEAELLDKLSEETVYMYVGQRSSTETRVTVERAEVTDMSSEEYGYIRDYIKKFVDAYYAGYDTTYYFNSYMNALVPYVLHKHNSTGSPFLMVGLIMLFVIGIVTLIVFFVKKKAESKNQQYSYVGPVTNNFNYNASYGGDHAVGNVPHPVNTGLPTPSANPTFPAASANPTYPTAMSDPAPTGNRAPYDLSKMRPPTAPERTGPDPIPDLPPVNKSIYQPNMRPPEQRPTPEKSIEAVAAVDLMLKREKAAQRSNAGGLADIMFKRKSMKGAADENLPKASPMSPEELVRIYSKPQYSGSHSPSFTTKRYEGVDDRPLPPLEGEKPPIQQQPSGMVRPNLYEDEFSKYVPYGTLYERKEPVGDSMPSIDPGNREYVDISNGGIPQDEALAPNIVKPHNNGVPIINPDRDKAVDFNAIPQPAPFRQNTSGNSMPSIDPGNREYVDISNGGIPQDETLAPNIVKSHNNGVPIVNPDRDKALDFGTVPQSAPTEPPVVPAPPGTDFPKVDTTSFNTTGFGEFPKVSSTIQDLPKADSIGAVPQSAPTEPPVVPAPTGTDFPKVDTTSFNITGFGEFPKVSSTIQDLPKADSIGMPTMTGDSSTSDEAFSSRFDIPEMPQAPEVPRYTGGFPAQQSYPAYSQPEHPIVSPYIQSSLPGAMPSAMPSVPEFPTAPKAPEYTATMPSQDFSVSQTDQTMRAGYGTGGGMMQEVDPYTEKNVDLSNGGRELPDDE